jgi:hypothetical protein
VTRIGEPPPQAPLAFRVVVLAKYPALGTVKTRLARQVGVEAASALSRAFVLDLDERLRADGLAPTWAYWPPDAPFAELVPRAALVAQQGGDLGERLEGIVERVMAQDARPVIMVGADVPHLDTAVVRRAGAALEGGAEVVLGPADDGGYYLLGLVRTIPELFRGITWGSERVCVETRARCAALGVRLRLMPATFDVDEPRDLVRLAHLIRVGAVALPRTAAVLARTGLS